MISISHVYVYFGSSRLVRAGSIIKTVISFHVLYFPFGCHRIVTDYPFLRTSIFDRSDLAKGSSFVSSLLHENLHVVVRDTRQGHVSLDN